MWRISNASSSYWLRGRARSYPRSSYNVLAWLVGEFVNVECWLLMLFACFVVAARITPGAPRRLSLDQDSGLMLRGTSGVPGHQAQSGEGIRG